MALTPIKFSALPVMDALVGDEIIPGVQDGANGTFTPDMITAYLRSTMRIREILTANRTYYIRSDGDDSNSGLTNTAGGAFKTRQKAWNTVAALDLSIYSVTIRIIDGTYTDALAMNSMPLGGSGIYWTGNTGTPDNCHLNLTSTAFQVGAPLPCTMYLNGFKITTTGASLGGVVMGAPGNVQANNIIAGGGSTGFKGFYSAECSGARIFVGTGQSIIGSMSAWLECLEGGVIKANGVGTVTLTGTPAFSWSFAQCSRMGGLYFPSATFSGAGTGTRYSCTQNSVILTSGAGESYFPGDVAGVANTGGQYV